MMYSIELLSQVDVNSGEYYDWGKDDGCDHFKFCPKGNEYCSKDHIGTSACSPDFKNKAHCTTVGTYNPECPVRRSYEYSYCLLNLPKEIRMNPIEKYGAHSRCFMWTHVTEDTAHAECNTSKVTTSIFDSSVLMVVFK